MGLFANVLCSVLGQRGIAKCEFELVDGRKGNITVPFKAFNSTLDALEKDIIKLVEFECKAEVKQLQTARILNN